MNFSFRPVFPLAALVAFGIFTACGVAGRATLPGSVHSSPDRGSSASGTSRSLSNVQRELYEAHDEWRGTPYVLGGSSRSGVDCSSFIQIVFGRHFGVDMPRNTRQQLREGRGVRRSSVLPGDLIFFRTTRSDLHVGIALNKDEFLHASTSSGVMISNVNERYWATRFLGVRRVL